MGPLRLVARPMLSAIFVHGGMQQITDPAGHAPVATHVTQPVREAAEDVLPADAPDPSTAQLVQLNGLAQVIGGLLLAAGKLPRVAALLLAGTLVPTTLAGHRFWDEADPDERQAQQIHFVKNISLLGGLLIATMDREGKPSLAWRSGHAVDHAKLATEHAGEVARLQGELAREKAKRATSVDAADHLRVRKELAKKQLTPDVADAKKLVDALRSDD